VACKPCRSMDMRGFSLFELGLRPFEAIGLALLWAGESDLGGLDISVAWYCCSREVVGGMRCVQVLLPCAGLGDRM
jgi:hypothetical protein